MKTMQDNVRTTLEQTTEAMKKYYNRLATPQPDIEIDDLIMLNAKTLRANDQQESSPYDCTAHLTAKGKKGRGCSNSISRLAGKSTQYFTSRYSNPIKSLTDSTENNLHEPREPEDVEGDLEWEVKRIVKSDIITYTRKVRRVNKELKEL